MHYDKPFVFGTTTTKTLTYRVFFKFKVRNGDISAFIRDVDTNQFITNANIAENGFYIDVANSQYLSISIKREVLSESLDGLVEDTKFSGVAKEGRYYKDEGVYTVTVKNLATGDSVEKRVYVGNSDILKAHIVNEISISEINERLAAGAVIDENGYISDYAQESNKEDTEIGNEVTTEIESDTEETSNTEKNVEQLDEPNEMVIDEQKQNKNDGFVLPVIMAIIVFQSIVFALKMRKKKETVTKEADVE